MRSPVIRRRLVVHGRVQGVYYRASTRTRAQREGVAGWAANLPDGAVEVVLEGPVAAVEAVARFCGRGPRGAQVDRIETSDEEPSGLRGFEIR